MVAREIARHARCYGEGTFVADPLHYLAPIGTKPNALDQAAALQGWNLPEVFQHLRHLLEARMGGAAQGSGDAQHRWKGCGGNRGKRAFVQVLRLLEALPLDVVTGAATHAIQIGAISFDAVKPIALAPSNGARPGSTLRPVRICRRPR